MVSGSPLRIQALPQFPRTGEHLEKDSNRKIQKYRPSPQTHARRCVAAAPFPVQKETKTHIRAFLSDCPSPRRFGLKPADKRHKHPPKAPPPRAIRIFKVNKKWYSRERIAVAIPGRILILAPLHQICHLGKLLFPLLTSTAANNFCLLPSCVLWFMLFHCASSLPSQFHGKPNFTHCLYI